MGRERHVFHLYIAGAAPSSARAVMSLRRFCAQHLPDRHDITVIDVAERPDLALDAGVVALPTLIIAGPRGERRLVGDLSPLAQVVLKPRSWFSSAHEPRGR